MKGKQSVRKALPRKIKPARSLITARNENRRLYLGMSAILLITFLVYLPALHNNLLNWDDNAYITDNLLIRTINLKDIFSRFVMGNYHPLTILVLAVEYKLFGLDAVGYHAVNISLHLINTMLVCYTVLLLSDKIIIALVAALLFGVHPLHVESVAWAAELKDLLYTLFFLASYIFYLKYIKIRQTKFLFIALLLFLLSLLSKAMAASLPAVLLLTDYFKGRKINVKVILEKVPFLLLAGILGIVAVFAQKGAIQDIDIFTFPQRMVFACYGFVSYLFKTVLPVNLSAYYPYPIKSGSNIPVFFYSYLLLFIIFSFIVFHSLKHTKKLFFGIAFFAITVFLVLQLLPVGNAIMADRYSYIPTIGIL